MADDVVIPFPAPVVPIRIEVPRPRPIGPVALVEHDGEVYQLTGLLVRLPQAVLDKLVGSGFRTPQQTWDLVVRRWPLAAKAAVQAASTGEG